MKSKNNENQIAFTFLRLAMGLSFFGHGLVRIPKLTAFRDGMVANFEDSLLPSFLVSTWATVLPILEFAIGLLLILGLKTYKASIAGATVMLILILGSCMIESWQGVFVQMVYVLFYAIIIVKIAHNRYSVDHFLKSK